MNFYTSDTHFSHKNIIRYCSRPFASIDKMDEAMIGNWNAVVGPDDDVWHLGDFALADPGKIRNFVRRLNGRIHLVWGNHDSPQVRALDCWASSSAYEEIKDQGQFLVLCHYKFAVFNKSHYGAIQLYGHSHGSLPGNDQQIDVGVDCFKFTPVTLDEIKEALKTLPPFKASDHHHPR